MAKKGKMPPELVAHFKSKGEKSEDGKEKSDDDKRKDGLKAAMAAKKYKKKKDQEK